MQGDRSIRDPCHGQPFPCKWGAQGDEQQGSSLPVGDFQQDSWMPGCLASPGETQRPLSAPIDRHPDEARLAPSITSLGCSSEALFTIRRQLKLLNSNNTCYLNAFVLSWLHAITQTGCTEHAGFGCRSQAWRDVLYSGKPIHVHALPSVFLRAGRMRIDSTMLEKCLSTGLPRVGPRWSVAGGRPDLRKGSW